MSPHNLPLNHWLHLALEQLDARINTLMAQHPDVALGLANLAARNQVGAAHIHITRHLPPEGCRLTELAQHAQMSKQAMAALVQQCEAWGMVQREPDPRDGRAQRIVFSATGMAWRRAYLEAAAQAEREMQAAIGMEVATVLRIGLEAYCGQ